MVLVLQLWACRCTQHILGAKTTPVPPCASVPLQQWQKIQRTSRIRCKNHLAEVVRSKPGRPVHMGKRHIPLVKSLFCPKSASPNEFWSGPLQNPPPHLKPTFFKRGGVTNVEEMTPPFLVSEIMNLLVFFFDFQPKKCFRVPTPWGLYGADWDERFAVYGVVGCFCYVVVFGNLSDPMVPTLRSASGDVVTVYAY